MDYVVPVAEKYKTTDLLFYLISLDELLELELSLLVVSFLVPHPVIMNSVSIINKLNNILFFIFYLH